MARRKVASPARPTVAALALATQGFAWGTVEDQANQILDCARINADDTVYADKAAPVSEWENIAFASLVDLLCSNEASEEARAWFTARGVRF